MDPKKSTREEFTRHLTGMPVPEPADPEYRKTFVGMRKLLDLLAHHDAMRPNINQTFMTPAASKNKVYFMWDFVGRTLGFLTQLDPERPSRDKSMWSDVQGRTTMAALLIKDKTGRLDMMMGGGGGGENIEFGQDILTLADELS